jgi:hypothetical protein
MLENAAFNNVRLQASQNATILVSWLRQLQKNFCPLLIHAADSFVSFFLCPCKNSPRPERFANAHHVTLYKRLSP